jgi:hypothetical protein
MPAGWPSQEFPTICPHCDEHHEVATLTRGELEYPDDGDVSLCFKCGRFCVFDSDAYGGMRKPNKKEQRVFDRDDRLQELVRAWRIVKRG